MTSTLLIRDAVVHTGTADVHDEAPSCVVVQDDRIVHVGDDAAAAYPGAEVLHAQGALVAPAFVDAHVHTVMSGYLRTQLDLSTVSSLGETLELVARAARELDDPDEVIVGQGWDDSAWKERRPPTATELDDVAPGARIFLTRLDGHSAVLSPALMLAIDGLPEHLGYGHHGHMTLDAMAHAVAAMGELIGPRRRLAAARAAMVGFASQGIAAFHEAAAPHLGPAYEVELVRQAAAEAGLLPTVYWGVHLAVEEARALGARGLAGDLNADGSIGSRTAALHTPYEDRPGHTGHVYLTPEEMAAHVVLCTREGLQAGFHCIGESGVEALTEGFRLAEKELGRDAIRAAGHRLEHVEMATSETLAMMADLGLHASMQPLFDELWGGPEQMYAERLGERWRGMNSIGAMHRAGINVALGSDTPVTRPMPWDAIRAACRHHEVDQRVDRATAFRMHTVGGWRATADPDLHPDTGTLVPGAPAHLAVWRTELDGSLPALDASPVIERLVVAGRTVHRSQPAEEASR
ncbi:MAG TPA: amidohydrolase family protein [Marmoricola sp.]|nr:amidohydrolase family protein [Marmoricola sp.]